MTKLEKLYPNSCKIYSAPLPPGSSFDSLVIDSAMSEKFKNGVFVTGGCTVEPENYYCRNFQHAW